MNEQLGVNSTPMHTFDLRYAIVTEPNLFEVYERFQSLDFRHILHDYLQMLETRKAGESHDLHHKQMCLYVMCACVCVYVPFCSYARTRVHKNVHICVCMSVQVYLLKLRLLKNLQLFDLIRHIPIFLSRHAIGVQNTLNMLL